MLTGRATDGGTTAPVRYDTPTGEPCPRAIRLDGSVAGDGSCHMCGMGAACPLFDPWAGDLLD